MKRTALVFLAATLFAWNAAAQSQSGAQASASTESKTSVQAGKSGAQASSNTSTKAGAQAGPNSAGLASGTSMNAVLSNSVDAKKNKPGDTVSGKTTESVKSDGQVIIPKGSKLVGHVTEARARARGESESALGIVFDKAILKNGQEVPLDVSIQALAAAQSAASSSLGDTDIAGSGMGSAGGSARSSGGVLGGVTSTAGGAIGAVTNTAANVGSVSDGAVGSTVNAAGAAHGAVGGLNAAGQLTSNSQGVFGLNGLNLNSAVSNSTQGSVITSSSKNVHLDSGTRMLLVAQGQAQGQAQGASKQPEPKKPEPKPEPRN